MTKNKVVHLCENYGNFIKLSKVFVYFIFLCKFCNPLEWWCRLAETLHVKAILLFLLFVLFYTLLILLVCLFLKNKHLFQITCNTLESHSSDILPNALLSYFPLLV